MGAIINKLPPITTTQSVEFAKAIVKAHRNPFAHTTTVRVAAAYVPMESFIAYVVIKEIQTHGEEKRITWWVFTDKGIFLVDFEEYEKKADDMWYALKLLDARFQVEEEL